MTDSLPDRPLQVGDLVYYRNQTGHIGLVSAMADGRLVEIRYPDGRPAPAWLTKNELWRSLDGRLAQEQGRLERLLARRAIAIATFPPDRVKYPTFERSPTLRPEYAGGEGLTAGELVGQRFGRQIGLIVGEQGILYRVRWSDGQETLVAGVDVRDFDAWIAQQVRLLVHLRYLWQATTEQFNAGGRAR
jgi:hypothetical protein